MVLKTALKVVAGACERCSLTDPYERFTGPALIAVFFLKLKQQSCINMFKLLLLLL